MTLSGLYTPFGELGAGTLRMVASIHGVTVAEGDIDELKKLMNAMPAIPTSSRPSPGCAMRVSGLLH